MLCKCSAVSLCSVRKCLAVYLSAVAQLYSFVVQLCCLFCSCVAVLLPFLSRCPVLLSFSSNCIVLLSCCAKGETPDRQCRIDQAAQPLKKTTYCEDDDEDCYDDEDYDDDDDCDDYVGGN